MALTIKDDVDFGIKEIKDALQNFEIEFNYKYSKVFKEISVQFLNSLINHANKDIKNKIEKIYINKEEITEKISYCAADEFKSSLEAIKDHFRSFELYEQDTLLYFINSSDDIIFRIMNN